MKRSCEGSSDEMLITDTTGSKQKVGKRLGLNLEEFTKELLASSAQNRRQSQEGTPGSTIGGSGRRSQRNAPLIQSQETKESAIQQQVSQKWVEPRMEREGSYPILQYQISSPGNDEKGQLRIHASHLAKTSSHQPEYQALKHRVTEEDLLNFSRTESHQLVMGTSAKAIVLQQVALGVATPQSSTMHHIDTKDRVQDLRQQLAEIRRSQLSHGQSNNSELDEGSSPSCDFELSRQTVAQSKYKYTQKPTADIYHYYNSVQHLQIPSQDLAHILSYQEEEEQETHNRSLGSDPYTTNLPILAPVAGSTKFSLLKTAIESSFTSTKAYNSSKSFQKPIPNQSLENRHSKSSFQEPCSLGETINQTQAKSESKEESRLSHENRILRQKVKMLEQNECLLNAQLEQQDKRADKERKRWDASMLKMQTEVTQLNQVLQSLISEKRTILKCRCRHRVRDLERQVLDLHKDLYQQRRGNIENENPSYQPRAPALTLSLTREDITPKPSAGKRRIVIPLSTKNVELTDTEVLQSFLDPEQTTKKRSHSRKRSASTSAKASSKKVVSVCKKPKITTTSTTLNARLIKDRKSIMK